MRKIYIMLALFLSLMAVTTVGAEDSFAGATITMRIEGAAQTIAAGTVTAYTFREALEQLAVTAELTLTFVQSGEDVRLYSIEQEKEAACADGNCQWLAYLLREGRVQEASLNTLLANGDELVLYYGEPEKTRLVSHLTCEATENELRFFIGSSVTEWTEKDGVWAEELTILPVKGAMIQVFLPGKEAAPIKVITDSEGRAVVGTTGVGAARYYADGFQTDKPPLIVRTKETSVLFGFGAENTEVTRAQAVAFWVQAFSVEKGLYERVFPDVDETMPFYEAISVAASQGLITGYDDGLFRPEQPISLMQFCVLTARLFPNEPDTLRAETVLLPLWAANGCSALLNAGFLEEIETNWEAPLSQAQLLLIYTHTEHDTR